jgi:hypothetical protein
MLKYLRLVKILTIQILALYVSIPSFASTCPEGEYWISPHVRAGYFRYDGVKVSPADVRGHCRINPRGYEKWHQRLSNERPKVWGYKNEKSKIWTADEAERVYDAIAILPKQLLELSKVEIHRMTESISKENPATSNFENIVLYDLAFKHKVPLEQILTHELAHVLYYTLDRDQIKEFAHSADWKSVQSSSNVWVTKNDKIFIEKDSRSSVIEDFANHIEHYLFKNESLKKSSQESYHWINKTFGKEFKIQEKK